MATWAKTWPNLLAILMCVVVLVAIFVGYTLYHDWQHPSTCTIAGQVIHPPPGCVGCVAACQPPP